MLELKFIDFVNEDMGLISRRKLRDAIHDIIVELKYKETIDVEDMCNDLMIDYKITISPFFLDKFLDDYLKFKRGDKKINTIFDRNDSKWLGIREINGTKEMRNNLLYLKPNLSKHKRKLIESDEKKMLDDIYKSGMKDLSFSEDIIKKSLILQRPEDSIDIIKMIYNDIVLRKKYDNTYDNCWKLMILIAKNNKLDRIRGWFKFAPESVRSEYAKNGRINYDLTSSKNSKNSNKNSNNNNNNNIEKKSDLINKKLIEYKKWGEFIKNITLRELIELIESISPVENKKDEFNTFLSKIDEMNEILMKYYNYNVKKNDIISFYKNIGLASYLREWNNTNTKPKINDF